MKPQVTSLFEKKKKIELKIDSDVDISLLIQVLGHPLQYLLLPELYLLILLDGHTQAI